MSCSNTVSRTTGWAGAAATQRRCVRIHRKRGRALVLLKAHHGRQLGNDLRQHLRVGEQHPQHVLSAKQPEQLTAQPFRRDLLQELPAPPQRRLCLFLQREA